jgi:hypothetical protein
MPDHSSASPATASVSAAIAAANAHPPQPEPSPRFPGEDGGRSLAEMAHLDLDAALQLLAERAQYITAANGAAIALRRGDHNDMLCRASTGANAPELGSLLSMEYGLSGECVRTRQPLRCDDADRDPRVNHDVCRHLGIASVVVMPIVSDQQVLGVFELFSGKPRAFEERDLAALQRLSEMVETAVRHAAASLSSPPDHDPLHPDLHPLENDVVNQTAVAAAPVEVLLPEPVPAPLAIDVRAQEIATPKLEKNLAENPAPEKTAPEKPAAEKIDESAALLPSVEISANPPDPIPTPAPRKPLFWSAATQPEAGAPSAQSQSIAVPPVLRNLQKCQACGFPVSQGRTFCVECEEKQWRGQRLPKPAAAQQPQPETKPTTQPEPLAVPATATAPELPLPITAATPAAPTPVNSSHDVPEQSLPQEQTIPAPSDSTLFSSSVQSESWLAANKYILAALLVVAIVIAAIAWFR